MQCHTATATSSNVLTRYTRPFQWLEGVPSVLRSAQHSFVVLPRSTQHHHHLHCLTMSICQPQEVSHIKCRTINGKFIPVDSCGLQVPSRLSRYPGLSITCFSEVHHPLEKPSLRSASSRALTYASLTTTAKQRCALITVSFPSHRYLFYVNYRLRSLP